MSPEKVVAGQLAAYNQRDLERFLGFYVDQVPVRSFPSGTELPYSGTTFRPQYQWLFESRPNLHAELVSRVVHGRIVIDQELVTGLMDDEVRVVAIYQVGPQQIEKVWFVD